MRPNYESFRRYVTRCQCWPSFSCHAFYTFLLYQHDVDNEVDHRMISSSEVLAQHLKMETVLISIGFLPYSDF